MLGVEHLIQCLFNCLSNLFFPNSVELATLTRADNKTKMTILKQDEVKELIAEQDRLEKEEEARKKREAEARPPTS